MKLGVISLGSESSNMVVKAAEQYFNQVDHLNLKKIEVALEKKTSVLYEGNPIQNYDCMYVKGSFRYAQLLQILSTSIQKHSYTPILPKAFALAHDKILTQIALAQHNIPMPATYLTPDLEESRELLKRIHYPIIIKFPQGTQGKGVMYAESYAVASSILDALDVLRQPLLIQEYLETDGEDIRAIVVGDRVVASMKRKAQKRERRANIHAGGTGEKFVLDHQGAKVAVKAAHAIGARVCAVDMLEGIKGYEVIEVNISPGLQAITKTTEINVAEEIAKFLYHQCTTIREKIKKDHTKNVMRELQTNSIKSLISTLDFRDNKILLPELFTKVTGFKEQDEFEISAEKGELTIKRFKL